MKNKLNTSLNLYKKMYLIRGCEEKIVEHYDSNEMKTPMHMSMGEEAIIAGMCEALKKKDYVFGTYRSHALYLARSGKIDEFFLEMFGKSGGTIKGKGGSMHLSDPENGFLATSAVVATTIPLAVGCAFSAKAKKTDSVSIVFFGDGAIDEGAFWESLNMACAFQVPVVFVCEDNGFAVHTPPKDRHGYRSITEIVSKFNCKTFVAETTDVEKINQLANSAVEFSRKRKAPVFIHLKYYRYLEHVGTHDDFEAGYRGRLEFEKWLKKDPVKIQRKKILKMGIKEETIKKLEEETNGLIAFSFNNARLAKFPDKAEILKDVYYEG